MESQIQLVRRAKLGDTGAFAKLYEAVYQDLYRFALYTLKNPHDAQDAVSDTVTDAFATIAKLRADEAFCGWIFKILSNKCKHKLREYAKNNQELTEAVAEHHAYSGMDEQAAVRSLFFELEDEERMILAMHLFCGYTSREMSDILHMNENTIRSKQSRALKKMTEQYWD